MTKWELAELMFNHGRKSVSMRDSSGFEHRGTVLGIDREDGSGRSFNVRMMLSYDEMLANKKRLAGTIITFHMRTTD